MKRFALAVALVLAFALTASAEIKQFARFSVDVPEGWTTAQEGDTVNITAKDNSASLSVTLSSTRGVSIKDIAAGLSRQHKGSEPEESNGSFTFALNDGRSNATVVGDDKDFLSLIITGEHAQLGDIIDSIKEN